MRPTPKLIAIAIATWAVALFPVILAESLWPVVALGWIALLGVVIAEAWSLRDAARIARVQLPVTSGVGEELEAVVHFDGARPRAMEIRSECGGHIESGTDIVVGADETETAIPVRALARGPGEITGLWSRQRGPLGLLERIRHHKSCASTVVRPSFSLLQRIELQHFGAVTRAGGPRQDPRRGDEGEFDSLVPYVPGLPVKHIDWKATARHMSPRVRRHRLERNQRVVCCFDLGRLMTERIDGVPRLEHALHASLLVSRFALRAGDLVGLHGYGAEPRVWVPPRAGRGQFDRIVAAMGPVAAAPEPTNHVLGLSDLLGRLRRRSLVLVFTDFTDSTMAELMVQQLGELARRHVVLFVALRDPHTSRPYRTEPASLEAAARAVVLREGEDDRQHVLERIRRAGVHVVEGDPVDAAVEAARAYLEIKIRGTIG